jgi:hypothetical protein
LDLSHINAQQEDEAPPSRLTASWSNRFLNAATWSFSRSIAGDAGDEGDHRVRRAGKIIEQQTERPTVNSRLKS